jgi:hypothetical protein
MSSVRKSQPALNNPQQLAQPAATPARGPRRRHPLLLAVCTGVLIAWLCFLAFMAFRG